MKTLLIAAQPRTRRLLSEALKRRKHEVTVVEGADAACTALQSGDYRLVILETDGLDGEAVVPCCQLRAISRDGDCMIVAAGESRELENVRALLAAGADDYLTDLDDTEHLDVRLTVAERWADGRGRCRPGQELAGRLLIGHCPVLHDAPCGVFQAGIDGRLLDVNPALTTMLGYDSEEELLGVDVLRDVYQDPADFQQVIAQLTDRGHLEGVEFGWKRKDGTPLTVLQSGRAVRDDTGAVVQIEGMVYDASEQKRAEEALKESEQRFRAVFDHAVDGLTLADAETRQLHLGNQAFCQMLGYSPEEIANLTVEDLHPEENLPYVIQHFEEQVRGEHSLAEDLPMKRKGGSVFYADISSFPITSAGKVQLVGIFRDVTQRKQAQEALKESEQRFRAVFDHAVDGMALADAETKRIFMGNRAFCQMLGCSQEEIRNLRVTDIHPEEDVPRVMEEFEQQASRERTLAKDTPIKRKDGSIFYADINSFPIALGGKVYLAGVFRDVTERKRAEEVLRKSEERLRKVLENMPVMLDALDADGNIIVWNHECERVTGYHADEIVGNPKAMQRLYPHGVYRTRMLEEWRRRGGDYREWEWEITCKDGSTKTIAWSNISQQSPVFGWATWGIGVDVTERKNAEQALAEELQRNRLILDTSMDGFYVLDLEGRFLDTNPSTCALFGYTRAELLSMNVRDIEALESPEETTQHIKRVRQAGLQRFETKQRRKDGKLLDVEISVHHRDFHGGEFLFAFVRDVTQRRQAERALRESESRFRTLFENMPDLVLVMDHGGRVQYANHAGAETPRDEFIGEEIFRVVAPEYREPFRRACRQAIETGMVQTCELRSTGGQWWDSRTVPILEEGAVGSLMAIGTNITERKKASQALQKEQQLLRHLLEIQEGDRQLVAYEIHDGFSQCLTGALYNLQGFRELQAQKNPQAWKTFDTALSLIHESINEARRLIAGLRPLILDESGIVAAIEYLACEAQENSEAEVEFIHDVKFERLAPPLESAIFRIVQESLTNARRHSQSAKIRIELVQEDDHVRIGVRDWGIGFNPAKVEEGRFGLRGIRERARLFGGQVTIETAPQQGTQIRVELPLIETPGKPSEP